MKELTEKLLLLDSQSQEELQASHKLAQEMMLKADTETKEMMDAVEKTLEKQKENDLKTLFKKTEKKSQLAKEVLEKNMQEFDSNFDVDKLVEDLIDRAKEKVCL